MLMNIEDKSKMGGRNSSYIATNAKTSWIPSNLGEVRKPRYLVALDWLNLGGYNGFDIEYKNP